MNMDSKTTDIEIVSIVICYNNALEVSKYADSLFDMKLSEKVFLVIVINSILESDIPLIEHIGKKHSNVLIVNPKKNLGYMNGLIYGYRQYSALVQKKPRFVLMSNTDIEFRDDLFFEKLLSNNYLSDIWCIGPSIFTKYTSNYDNPVEEKRRSKKKINSLIRRFSIPVFSWLYVYLSLVKPRFIKRKKTDSRFVYEVHGCFFILTGGFPEILKDEEYGALLYSEEAFIAELVFQNGKKVYYDASLEVVHVEHTTTKLLGIIKEARYLSSSMRYIKDRFYK